MCGKYQGKTELKKLKKHRERQQVWRTKSRNRYMLINAKQRAKRYGYEFNIDLSDIVIPDLCPLLQIPITVDSSSDIKSRASLDRIDSTKGYIKGNVQVISWMANRIKTNATEEELLAFSRNYLVRHKGVSV